jgi:hypothetical protein
MKNIWNTNRNSQSPYTVQNITGSGQDNHIVVFDGNSGKSIKDSTVPLYAWDDSIGIGINSQKLGANNIKCISLGPGTLKDGTDNVKEIAIGSYIMEHMTGAGATNIAIGHSALRTSVNSSSNIAIGEYCMNNATSATDNICIGNATGQLMDTALNNICIGSAAGYNLASGINNILIGTNSGYNYTVSTNNILIGNHNGLIGENNTITIGDSTQNTLKIPGIAYYSSTLGNTSLETDLPNKDPALTAVTAIGESALLDVTTGIACTATGALSMQHVTTGSSDCAFGYSCLRGITTGSGNTAFRSQTGINYKELSQIIF